MKKLRRLGDVTLDLEQVLDEMTTDHDLQWGEVLHLVYAWLVIHAPANREEYISGGHPEFFYGYKPKDNKNGK